MGGNAGLLVRWVGRVVIALDQLVNALVGGSPDETISSRLARHRHRWWGRAGCAVLDALDAGHCREAVRAELEGRHRPP
jgi:hypothetical protein